MLARRDVRLLQSRCRPRLSALLLQHLTLERVDLLDLHLHAVQQFVLLLVQHFQLRLKVTEHVVELLDFVAFVLQLCLQVRVLLKNLLRLLIMSFELFDQPCDLLALRVVLELQVRKDDVQVDRVFLLLIGPIWRRLATPTAQLGRIEGTVVGL